MTASIIGLGGWLPPSVVTNADLCATLDTTDEWIETRTGISERRHVRDGMSTGDLAVEAGARALKCSGESTVDAVIVATTSPDRLCPAVAPEVAFRLGLGTVPAFDLTSACSGFVYGLATAVGLISSGTADRALFIGAEAFTTLVNPDDRATAPIFGDGAGAVVLKRANPGDLGVIGAFDLGSDGERADLLAIEAGGSRQRSAHGLGLSTVAPSEWYLHMEGKRLFKHAVERMTQSAAAALDRAGWSVQDVDWFIGHQANARIVRDVADKLELAADRVAINIGRVGNTLAASVPILLTELAAEGRLRAGHRVLISAFGAGLSWGSTVLTWPELTIEAIE